MNKKVEKNLISGFDQLVPDRFAEISSAEPKHATSEAELFSELGEKDGCKSVNFGTRFGWKRLSIAAVTLATVVLITVFSTANLNDSQVVGHVIIDVNPSVSFAFNKDNIVEKVSAENSDGKEIVKAISSEINKSTTTDEAVKILMSKLRENGYFKKAEADMIVSCSYNSENANTGVEKSVKKAVNEYAESNKLKTECVYQTFENDKNLNSEAKSKSISAGKYYFLKKVKNKYNINVDGLMDKPVRVIYNNLQDKGIDLEKDGSFEVVKTADGKINTSTGNKIRKKASKLSKAKSARKAGDLGSTNSLNSSDTSSASSKPSTSTESGTAGTESGNSGGTDDTGTSVTDAVTIVDANCTPKGTIKITFDERVYYSSGFSVSVSDENGSSIESTVTYKERKKLFIDTDGMKKATTYYVTISGIKSAENGNEQSLRTTVISKGKS